jgi:hypothetical protein
LCILLSLMHVSHPNRRTSKISLSTTTNTFFFQYHCTFFTIPYIYILLPFSSFPFQKNVNLIFQIPPSTPLTNSRFILFCLSHFLNYILIFHIQNSLPEFQSSPLSFLFYRYFHHHLCYTEECKRVFSFV